MDYEEIPRTGDERSTLLAFLAWQRATLARKCADLEPDQLRRRSVEPARMSPTATRLPTTATAISTTSTPPTLTRHSLHGARNANKPTRSFPAAPSTRPVARGPAEKSRCAGSSTT